MRLALVDPAEHPPAAVEPDEGSTGVVGAEAPDSDIAARHRDLQVLDLRDRRALAEGGGRLQVLAARFLDAEPVHRQAAREVAGRQERLQVRVQRHVRKRPTRARRGVVSRTWRRAARG